MPNKDFNANRSTYRPFNGALLAGLYKEQ